MFRCLSEAIIVNRTPTHKTNSKQTNKSPGKALLFQTFNLSPPKCEYGWVLTLMDLKRSKNGAYSLCYTTEKLGNLQAFFISSQKCNNDKVASCCFDFSNIHSVCQHTQTRALSPHSYEVCVNRGQQ